MPAAKQFSAGLRQSRGLSGQAVEARLTYTKVVQMVQAG
jgi:hypothetical protein